MPWHDADGSLQYRIVDMVQDGAGWYVMPWHDAEWIITVQNTGRRCDMVQDGAGLCEKAPNGAG